MNSEIIDADKFVLEQVFRPYQKLLGVEKRFEKQPFSNEETIEMLEKDTEWSRVVVNRISKCNFTYNKWINHPVINYLQARIKYSSLKEKDL